MASPTPAVRTDRKTRTSVSRAKILDAAVECLTEYGYAATTTLMIQGRAQISRGRLLHHFPSRDQLLIAAAQHLAAARVRETGEQIDRIIGEDEDLDPAGRVDRAVETMWSTYQQAYFWASTEIWVASRTDEDLRETILPQERRLYGAIREVVDHMFGHSLTLKPNYFTLRELLLTSMRGVALTYAFDRRDPARDPHLTQWKSIAQMLLT